MRSRAAIAASLACSARAADEFAADAAAGDTATSRPPMTSNMGLPGLDLDWAAIAEITRRRSAT